MSMIDMAHPNVLDPTTAQNRKVAIGKYRDNKPYTGQRGTDTADRIDNDVLEITSAVFIPLSRMVLIEYNHFGARPGHIIQYLNTFLPNSDANRWEFELVAQEPDRGISDVEDSDDIRSIEFKLDISHGPIRNKEKNEKKRESLLMDIIDDSVKTHDVFGANVATLAFSNGRSRKDNVIKPDQLVDLVKELNLEDELFESVKVRYKSPKTGNIENIDLKNAGILKKVIMKDEDGNSGWELVADEMQMDYYVNGRTGDSKYLALGPFEVKALPEIVTDFPADQDSE